MTVAVFQPQAKKSNLDTLQQALGIASNIYGVAMEKDKLDAAVEANKLAKQQHDDETNRSENYRYATDYEEIPVADSKGAPKLGVLTPEQTALVRPKNALPLPTGMGIRPRSYGIKEADQANAEKVRKEKSDETNTNERKQLGLFELGSAAELQYQQAVSNNKDYDPTSKSSPIDNSKGIPGANYLKSKSAILADNSEKAWIENFLRDASGAAIPESERNQYGEIYFPRPGDSPEAVANKTLLRKTKMTNALVNAGKTHKEAEGQVEKFFQKKENSPPPLYPPGSIIQDEHGRKMKVNPDGRTATPI
jgi:hypothetical protein